MKIEELDFTVRTYHALKRGRIDTVEQLQRMTDDDLYCIRNIGLRSIEEIRSKVPHIQTELPPTRSFADQIRAMSDEELCDAIFRLIYAADPATWFCTGKKECGELMNADKDIPDAMCKACLLAKLRQPADQTPRIILDDGEKTESGLLED